MTATTLLSTSFQWSVHSASMEGERDAIRRQYSHSHSLEAVPAPRILRTEGRALCKQGMNSRCNRLQPGLWCACCSSQQQASSGLWRTHMNMEGPTNKSGISPGSKGEQKRQQQSHCESVGHGFMLKRLFCNSGHLGALCSSLCRAFPTPLLPKTLRWPLQIAPYPVPHRAATPPAARLCTP